MPLCNIFASERQMMRSGSLSIHVLFEPEKVLAEERLSRRWDALDSARRGRTGPKVSDGVLGYP